MYLRLSPFRMSAWPARGVFWAALACLSFLLSALPADAAAPKRKGVDPSAYVNLDPMTVSIIEDFRVRGLMTLKIGLHIPDPKTRYQVQKRMTKIRDAMVSTMTAYGVTSMNADMAPDLDIIDHRLMKAIDQVVGTEGTRILFDHILVRQTN